MLTVRETAARLGLKESTVRKWILLRRLPYFKVGRRAVRFDEKTIEKFLREHTVPAREARQ